MENITYRELRDKLNELGDYQLDLDVTVYDQYKEEYFPIIAFDTNAVYDIDVVDPETPIIIIQA